ncbi:MAG: hypothetical protein QG636_22 [Patescibacteria group bacterium]|jgi:hypothetical protein|nr:hypothetical protein [Patescibacteria group bacterium]
MKQLLAGVVILFVVGFGSFLYRNTVERPGITAAQRACPMEAKICPDGTSVERTGPACTFSPCLLPNVEIPDAGISFVMPAGYVADENAYGADIRLLAAFVKPSLSGNPQHTIVVYRYLIPEGKTANDVILESTRYQPADLTAEDFSQFSDVSVNEKTFRETTIERFEALVHSSYYLVRESDVLRFDITEHDVTGWMEPGLSIRDLPEHAVLLGLLRSVQTTP